MMASGMKLAFSGKGGVGKTSITAWMADWLARCGHNVWMIDADTALSLGEASGLSSDQLPEPLVARRDIIRERIHTGGFLNMNPEVDDLPESLAVNVPVVGPAFDGIKPGRKRLLVMGAVTNAGGGCACDANALLKAILAQMVMTGNDCVLVDLEAGVEHLGRGTVSHVDGLVVVSEPSMRSFHTAADVGRMARELGLDNQVLVINRFRQGDPPALEDLPRWHCTIPSLVGLMDRQMESGNVLGLPESGAIDGTMKHILEQLSSQA